MRTGRSESGSVPGEVTTVVVASDYGFVAGGAEKVAIGSAVALAQSGLSVHFLAAIGPVDERLRREARVAVHCLGQTSIRDAPSRVGATLHTVRNAKSAQRTAAVLASLDPAHTIVHFHSYLGGLSASSLLSAHNAGFPTVLTLHDYGLACPQQSFYDHSHAERCLVEPLSLRCCTRPCTGRGIAFKAAVTLRALVNRHDGLAGTVSGFVAPSQFALDAMTPFLTGSPAVVIPNPIDAPDLGPAAQSETPRFLFVGRMTLEKEVATFLAACHLGSLAAVAVGDGPQLAYLRGAYPEARFVPWSNSHEVMQLIRSARAVVLPSRAIEAAPLVAYEAAANGVALVVAEATSAAHIVRNLASGLTFRGGDARHLAEVLATLADRDTAARLGRQAHANYWRAPLSAEAHVERLLAFYQELLSEPAGLAGPQ